MSNILEICKLLRYNLYDNRLHVCLSAHIQKIVLLLIFVRSQCITLFRYPSIVVSNLVLNSCSIFSVTNFMLV